MKAYYCIFLFLYSSASFALKNSLFQERLHPLDLYSPPNDEKNLLSRRKLFLTLAAKNLPIKSSKEDFHVAELNYDFSYATFNFPSASLNAGYSYAQTAGVQHDPNFSTASNAGLSLKGASTGWGVSYSLDVPKLSKSISSGSGNSSESDSVFVGATATLNLLRNSVFFEGRNPRNAVDLSFESAKLSLKSSILSNLVLGESAFYDVLGKQIRVRVAKISLDSAKALLSDVRDMLKAGEGDKLSVLKVELQVTQAETDLLAAETDYTTSLQALRDILAIDSNESFYPDPSSIKEVPPNPALTVEKALEFAKSHNPSFRGALIGKQLAEISVQTAFSNTLPQLDFTAGYGFSGQDTSFTQAFKNTKTLTNPQYSVGLTLSYALFNDPQRNAYRIAKINEMKSDYSLEQARNSLNRDVTTAVNTLNLGYRRLKMSELGHTLSEKKLESEFIKFRVGESSIRNITDYQNEVNAARTSEVEARITLLKAISQYKTVLGETAYEFTAEELP